MLRALDKEVNMSGADDAEVSLQGVRILLLEDDPLICLDLETSLGELGATVSAASSVAAAFAVLSAGMPDFAVLDFELGAETSEPVAEIVHARSVPFLFLSGYSEHDGRFAQWSGVPILTKPLSAAQLARGIHRALRAHRR
jgi:DNA-binding response OmpR family regulator